jgi:hypothetical protein
VKRSAGIQFNDLFNKAFGLGGGKLKRIANSANFQNAQKLLSEEFQKINPKTTYFGPATRRKINAICAVDPVKTNISTSTNSVNNTQTTGTFNQIVVPYNFTNIIQQNINSNPNSQTSTTANPVVEIKLNSWDGVINMNGVISAFARRHPNESKQRVFYYTSAKNPPAHDDLFTERMVGSNMTNAFRDEASQIWVYNMLRDVGGIVGFIGAFVMKKDATATWWESVNPLVGNSITKSDLGKSWSMQVKTYLQNGENGIKTFAGEGILASKIEEFGVKDFGGNIGKRWYVAVATDISVTPNLTKEWGYFDLGPSDGVYDPEYGMIEYKQTNYPDDPNAVTDEIFSMVVPIDLHANFFGYTF